MMTKKLTKAQLKEMVGREIRKQLDAKKNKPVKEGLAVDEDEYFRMKGGLEKDISKAFYMLQKAIDAIYDEEDAIDIIEEAMEILGRHVR